MGLHPWSHRSVPLLHRGIPGFIKPSLPNLHPLALPLTTREQSVCLSECERTPAVPGQAHWPSIEQTYLLKLSLNKMSGKRVLKCNKVNEQGLSLASLGFSLLSRRSSLRRVWKRRPVISTLTTPATNLPLTHLSSKQVSREPRPFLSLPSSQRRAANPPIHTPMVHSLRVPPALSPLLSPLHGCSTFGVNNYVTWFLNFFI